VTRAVYLIPSPSSAALLLQFNSLPGEKEMQFANHKSIN